MYNGEIRQQSTNKRKHYIKIKLYNCIVKLTSNLLIHLHIEKDKHEIKS